MSVTDSIQITKNLGKKLLLPILFFLVQINAFSQEMDSIRNIKLIFEPVQEVLEEQVGDVETEGILGSLPDGIDVKVKLEIEVADTTGLSKIYITLGSETGGQEMLNTFIDFPVAVSMESEQFFFNENIAVIELGTYPKPTFISCDAWLEDIEGVQSPKATYQTR